MNLLNRELPCHSHFSRYVHTAFCDLHKRENPRPFDRNSFESGPMTATVMDWSTSVQLLHHTCPAAASHLSSGCIRPSAAMQADWLYPTALTIKLGFPPPIFDNERQPVWKPLWMSWMFTYSNTLFLYSLQNVIVIAKFPPYCLRKGQILKLQMQVLRNPRFP